MQIEGPGLPGPILMTIRGFGLGLRPPHYEAILNEPHAIDWLEVITENFMVDGGNPRRVLRAARAHRPIVLHGVSMNLGGIDPLRADYLERFYLR